MVNFLGVTKSTLRRKILAYFFTNPESNLYLRETASLIDEDPGNLSKEFSRLEKEGIFTANKRGNQKYFSLNKNYPLYKELKSIIFKTIGVKGIITEMLKKLDNVKLSFIYGSYARAKEISLSDVDIMVIGNPDEDKLIKDLDKLEEQLKREINYKLYSLKEFRKEVEEKKPFILEILRDKKIMTVGDENELRKISKR